MKKLLALVLALIMAISLVACGGPSNSGVETPNPGASTPVEVTPPDPTVTYKDTVRISVLSERVITGFYGSTNQPATYLGRMTMEGLYRFNYQTKEFEPVIAKEAVDVNGDGKTWKVTIRDDVSFHHNGEKYCDLKASDVAFTYDFIKTGGAGREAGAVTRTYDISKYIDSIEVTGDYELVFNLNAALFDFTAWADALILSEKAIEEFGPADGQDVFTGPYYINEAKTTKGQFWTLTRYDDYWGGIENHPTKNIVFVIHTDENTGAAALQAGEVDVLVSSTPTIALQFQNNPAYTVYSTAGTNVCFLGFNSYDGTGFFDGEDTEEKVKLRQAINYAIDRDELVGIIYAANPSAGVRVDNMFADTTYGYVDQGKYEFSIEKGQQLMKELGYSETNRLTLSLAHYADYGTYGQVLQDQLKEIYIDVELNAIERSQFGTFLRTGEGWDMYINYYGTKTYMAGNVLNNYSSTGGSAKTHGWKSAAADEKVDYFMGQSNIEDQVKAFAEFQEWAHDYLPMIPTHAGAVMIEAKANVEGLIVCPNVGLQDYSTLRIPE